MSNDTTSATAIINRVRQQTNNQPKVKVFLDTISRNSLKTKRIYETALVHFQEYLNEKYDYKHTLERYFVISKIYDQGEINNYC